MKATKTFTLGGAIRIFVVLDNETPDTVAVTITDPCLITKVSSALATREENTVFSYIYQSAETDAVGMYDVTIKATFGQYTSITKSKFELE